MSPNELICEDYTFKCFHPSASLNLKHLRKSEHLKTWPCHLKVFIIYSVLIAISEASGDQTFRSL